MIDLTLNCSNCGGELDIYFNNDKNIDQARCLKCKKIFDIFEDTKYASAGTGSDEYYIYDENNNIKFIYFNNFVEEGLKEAVSNYYKLTNSEKSPTRLYPIVKIIHDILKERIIDTLSYDNNSKLSEVQKNEILYDPPGAKMNIYKIIYEILPIGLPDAWLKIKKYYNNKMIFIKHLQFVRNKTEHIAIRMWPTPSYIHEDFKKTPSDQSFIILDKKWVRNSIITVVELIQELFRGTGYGQEQIKVFDDFKNFSTP